MTTGTDDLWPEDLGSIEINSPVSIIRKQAALLGNKTSNLVEGIVVSEVDEDGDNIITFFLYAPALGDYRYKLFHIYHDIADMYPIKTATSDEQHSQGQIENEEELKYYLKRKFNSEKTLRIIRSLMAQSRS